MSPRVSVILATYNQAPYVAEAVRSVLAQTMTDFELIVVDDGSTDGTREVLDGIQDPRLSVISQRNAGPSSAFASAFARSKGELIALMSGDDVCMPHRLEAQVAALDARADVGCVLSQPRLIDPRGGAINESRFPAFFGRGWRDRFDLLRQLFHDGNFICAPTATLRRSVIDELGVLFRSASLQLQDFELWIRLAKRHEIAMIEARVLKYRIYPDNLSRRPEHEIRTRLEAQFIYRQFFDGLTRDEMMRVFPNLFPARAECSQIRFAIEKAHVYCSNVNPVVAALGLEQLFWLYDQPDAKMMLEGEYGFTLKRFFELTGEADILDLRRRRRDEKAEEERLALKRRLGVST